ncbi:50S ribosomal protein L9 [Eubacterium uniforme]|uniref:Large ribosomal subunit protein bL9 n=1 Tax=Eubacterium uniforme TaxID=39495 RepID=A0A1T4VR65_9FIRM|nr:50S ribosomal protein L9 [Eubacterium uniforme]SKA67355.1 LSU ribosomal protein L9P [Eubacterium uniforme]HAH17716.1 50S ribosomal protein L9 [Eubacterium sp.]
MEVILLEDVKNVGKKGERVTLSDGYARNCIIKKKLGVEATAKNINDLKLQKANDEKLAAQRLEEAKKKAEEIGQYTLKLFLKSGEGGKIFGSVSTKEIEKEAKEQLNLDIDKKKLVLAESIKTPGVYDVGVKLHPEVTATLKVNVSTK